MIEQDLLKNIDKTAQEYIKSVVKNREDDVRINISRSGYPAPGSSRP
jgi:hypothetical protein